ncbi:MAG: glycosyltransferase [Gemmatimonadales bacterium]|nr:glycosyltransferase [Gemmatimonadales bacterium]MDZ4390387.1 glycosyltransferase [Gemmatimonadales bacterium]
MKPLVSVCMISYNHDKFIRQAIESVLAQEVDFQIELVIGDDFSQDGTYEICESFARRDPRVNLLPRDRNVGIMLNVARTLQACFGEYVAVCEGDDYWTDPHKLSKQVAFLKEHPTFGGAAHQSAVLIHEHVARQFKLDVHSTITTTDLLGGRLFHTASVLFRRPVVDLFCQSPQVLSCDRLLNFCISFLGPIHYSEESMCAYRLHGEGMSSNATVAQMKLDLNCVDYLQALHHSFPKYKYLSYVYATIGLCKQARPHERVRFLLLSFIYSFSTFPHNIGVYGHHIFHAVRRRINRV